MVEIVEEIVATRLKRPYMDGRLAARGDHLLDMQLAAFEFAGDRAEILDRKRNRLSRRRVHLRGLELMVLDRKRQHYRLICTRNSHAQSKYGRKQY